MCAVDLAEVYSPALCKESPHAAWPKYGASCKLGEDWDLESRAHRQKCSNQLKHERKRVLIASPLCTSFSVLQDLDDGNTVIGRKVDHCTITSQVRCE